MITDNRPGAATLPTNRQLNRATLIAASVAAVLLVTTILPAEYGVDPTGIGGVLGLTAMGELKHAEAAAPMTVDLMTTTADDGAAESQSAEVAFVLPAGAGTEVKATMKAGDEMTYRWSTEGAEVHYELHGEPAEAVGNEYSSYDMGKAAKQSGTFQAPFDGTHGWYWRNDGERPVTITVSADGRFEKFVQVK